jgi:hypothetical protein
VITLTRSRASPTVEPPLQGHRLNPGLVPGHFRSVTPEHGGVTGWTVEDFFGGATGSGVPTKPWNGTSELVAVVRMRNYPTPLLWRPQTGDHGRPDGRQQRHSRRRRQGSKCRA